MTVAEDTDRVSVAPDLRTPPHLAMLQQDLAELQLPAPDRPFYEGPLGYLLDPAWVKEAKDRLRKSMTRPPQGVDPDAIRRVDIDDLARSPGSPDPHPEAMSLDLGDWESNIVYCPL